MVINGGFYPTIQNSLEGSLTAGVNSTGTILPVDHCDYYIPKDWVYTDVSAVNPVLAVVGYDSTDYTYPETVKIIGISAATGAGNLTVTRGIGGTATAGNARSWFSGDKVAVVLTSQHIYQMQNTLANLGYQQGIGVEWDTTSNSPTLSYVDQSGNTITPTATDFANSPIWGAMRRCNVADDGTVNAWYGDSDFAYDGSNGQVMVWIPAFYYASAQVDNDDHIRWVTSSYYQTGFKIHPAFVTDSRQIPGFYWGALEGCVYDVSEAAYVTDDYVVAGDVVDFNADKLSSIAGVKPVSGNVISLLRANARKLAENRGAGWQQIDFNQVSAIEMLFMVRYATLNSQGIFEGVTDLASGTGNASINTGYTAGVGTGSSDLGNTSGEVSVLATQPFSFYGIENFYGNIYKWVDGINIIDNVPWIADHGYVDDSFADPYVDTALTLSNANGYGSAIKFDQVNDHTFLASAVLGSNSTYLCDYYYQAAGTRAALFGGRWGTGAYAGAFNWTLAYAASYVTRDFGLRLAFIPQV